METDLQRIDRDAEEEAAALDPLVEQVEDECPTCGAYMLNQPLHRDWHRKQTERLRELAHETSRYKEPPRYG